MNETILIKLSGESLAGNNPSGRGLDDYYIQNICERLKRAHDLGLRIGIVVGGGNFMRGGRTSQVIDKEIADYMGMLGTIMNGLALYDALIRIGCPAYLQSGLDVNVPMIDSLNRHKANLALNDGKIVIFGGGTGHPGCSTDTASADRAIDIKADAIIKLTNVDGVFDKDPNKYDDALMYKEISFDDVLEKKLGIMDLEAIDKCRKHNIDVIVTNIDDENALDNVIKGVNMGTRVYNK